MKALLITLLVKVVTSQDVFGDYPWPKPSTVKLPAAASFTVQVAHLLTSVETPIDQWDNNPDTINFAWDTDSDCYHESRYVGKKLSQLYVYCAGRSSLY